MTDITEMDESEIVTFLGRKIEQALNEDDGDISEKRKNLLKAYFGDEYGDERDGHSKIVTREVLEAVEWAKPHIMRVFSSGNRVVSFVPAGPDDEEKADQETDVVRHVLFNENNGFMALYAWVHDTLMYPNGYAKIWVDETEEVRSEEYADLNLMEVSSLIYDTDDEIEPLESEITENETYNLKLKRIVRDIRIKFESCEPDQVLIDNDLASLDLEEADFVCHRVRRSLSWLIQNGHDPEELKLVHTNNEEDWGDERTNRLFYEDENPNSDSDDDDSMKEYWVHECYVRLDFDGDGIAERRRILLIGDKIFENEEDDYIPIIAMSCIPQPHKHTGVPIADLAASLQRVLTVLTRNMADNIYRTSINRKFLGESAERADGSTEEDIQDAEAEFIRVRDVSQVKEEVTQNKTVEILQAMQEISQQQKSRTGVSPDMSLNPDVLKESTMGAYMGALEQASERLEMVTRVFAETGIKTAMYKAHRLMREHMTKEKIIRLRGEYIQVDPTAWRDRKDLVVEVGTGFKSHEKKLMHMEKLLAEQKNSMQMGLPTVQPNNIYQAQLNLADAMGERNPNQYFTDPATVQPPQPQPNPQVMAIEAQVSIEQGKRQVEVQKMQFEREAAQGKAALSAKEAELSNYLKTTSAQHDNVIDYEKLKLEHEKLALQKYIEDRKLAAHNADLTLKEQDMNTKYALQAAQQETVMPIEAPKLPDVHIHNDGPKKIKVTRTESGLEGEVRPAE